MHLYVRNPDGLRFFGRISATVWIAGLVTSTAASAQANRPHTLTPGQTQAIMTTAMSWSANSIMPQVEKPRTGPMRALKAPDGSIEFCAFVYNGVRNVFGTINRVFVAGTFPSATSTAIVARRPTSDNPGPHNECQRKGIGVL
jgi:hypothetical protein